LITQKPDVRGATLAEDEDERDERLRAETTIADRVGFGRGALERVLRFLRFLRVADGLQVLARLVERLGDRRSKA